MDETLMDRDEFRAVQAPLKQRYRDDPPSALVTLRAGNFKRCSCRLQTGQASHRAGYRCHPGRASATLGIDTAILRWLPDAVPRIADVHGLLNSRSQELRSREVKPP